MMGTSPKLIAHWTNQVAIAEERARGAKPKKPKKSKTPTKPAPAAQKSPDGMGCVPREANRIAETSAMLRADTQRLKIGCTARRPDTCTVGQRNPKDGSMRKDEKQTKTEPNTIDTIETIETVQLDSVLGGCAACTNGQVAPCCKNGQCTQG